MKREHQRSPSGRDPRFFPLQGGYYWIPSPGDGSVTWDMLTCHEMGFDAEVGHVDLWPAVINRLAKTWNTDARVLNGVIKDCSYGLPRGRITYPGRQSLILHGNDAPVSGWRDKVIRRFDLDRRSTKVVYDEHETMLVGDRARVIETLGISLPEIRREGDVNR